MPATVNPRSLLMNQAKKGLRERIILAALDLLAQGGLKRLAQTQVANAVGIPQGHLTYYFPHKIDLMVAVARRAFEQIADIIDESGLAGQRLPESMRQRLIDFIVGLIRDGGRTRMMLALFVAAEEVPALRQLVKAHASGVRTTLAQAIGIDPDSAEADVALAILWGLGLQHYIDEERRSEQEHKAILRAAAERFDQYRERAKSSSSTS